MIEKLRVLWYEWLYKNGLIKFFDLPWIREFIEEQQQKNEIRIHKNDL